MEKATAMTECVIKAIDSLSEDQSALALHHMLKSVVDERGVDALINAIESVYGRRTKSSVPSGGGGSTARRGTGGIYSRLVEAYDPTLNNGYCITKGEFVYSLSTCPAGNLVVVATRGAGGKVICVGRTHVTASHTFTYPASGVVKRIEGFELIRECTDWAQAHAVFASEGVPIMNAAPKAA